MINDFSVYVIKFSNAIERITIPFLQDNHGNLEVIDSLFDHGMDTGYLMTVLKKSIHDRDVGITDHLRKKMGINQEATGTVYIMHYYINRSVARSKGSSTSEVTPGPDLPTLGLQAI